ncbi:hypothetical protein FVE85_6834 [Porphyridium purpureum]|uniref:MARVEL domain-containing protein n=1 Tax=Porphyridium purpureum TaxID=35688 RepID=A0A5J4Z5C8_PORPP|nr:hypothetical protein FVE85_6834 [Porphyridium purpureum]|eukprot:POR7133..scf295_1
MEGFAGGPSLFSRQVRAGDYSFNARKLMGELGIWFCSTVSFSAMADSISTFGSDACTGSCWYGLVVGIVSFLFSLFVLIMNYMTGANRDRSWFSQRLEMQFLMILSLWWIPGVGFLSSANTLQSTVGQVFSWFALAFSLYSTFEAYNVWAEWEVSKDVSTGKDMYTVSDDEDAAADEQKFASDSDVDLP